MSTVTLSPVPGWVVGETISAYVRDSRNVAVGSAVATAIVASNSTTTFTGLTAEERFIATDGTHEVRFGTHADPDTGGSGHVIEDEGTPLTARSNLNFTGAGVSASDVGGKTVVDISGAAVGDASATVKGVGKTSVAPASASNPIMLGVNDARVQPQITGTAAGNLGTAQTITFVGAEEQWLVGVLNGNLAVTVNNPVAGSRLRVLALQDATGSRTLTIAGTAVTIPTTATTGLAFVTAVWVDATNFRVESAGVYTESDPLAILKTLVDAKGDLIAASAADTVARVAVGTDGQVLKADSAASAGVSWTALTDAGAVPKSLADAKGDLFVATADNTVARLAVGSNDQVLTADSTQSGGVKWAAAAGGSSGAGGTTPFVAGKFYIPPITFDGSNHASTNGIAKAASFVPGRSCTLDGARVHVNTATGGSGALYRIAIYSDNGGIPGTLIDESTAVAVDATGSTTITGLSAAVTAGSRYWLVGAQQGSPSTASTFKGGGGSGIDPAVPVDPTNIAVGSQLQWSTSVTGAFPASGGVAADWSPGSDRIGIALSAST